MQRIGVFVCWCGSNIAATVEVSDVARELGKEPGVVFATDYQYMCSEVGQTLVRNAIREHSLTGVVVCACSPRMHEPTFRRAASLEGVNPFMVEIANIREQCSWVHRDKADGTPKAILLGKAAIAKLNLNAPLQAGQSAVAKRALVIGGGIAGIQTALDIADAGFPVDIVERKSTIGGTMAQLDKTFPTLDCAACILTPKMVEAAQHPNITLHTYSEVEEVSGFVGNFTVKIRKRARCIDEKLCSGCGECMTKCPQKKTPSEFDQGLRTRSAIYIPFAQAIPNVPVIDKEHCTWFKSGKCGLCQKVCTVGAIHYEQQDEILEEKYGAIIVATGFKPMSPAKFGEFGYDRYPDVVTSLEFERLCNAAGPTGGHLVRPSDHREPRRIVFVQCVGSRGECDDREKSYCSKICCMYTAKHAMLVREKYPDSEVSVFYIDVRTPGKNFDEFQRRAVEQYNVRYIKGMVGQVEDEGDGQLTVKAMDLLADRHMFVKADMVVLAMAVEPEDGARKLATMLTASMDTNDFFTEAHPKLRPVESPTAGVFLSGLCQGPKDIPETVAQAGAAAAKAIGLLAKDHLVTNPCVAVASEKLCNGCGQCEPICPYGAITYEVKETMRNGKRRPLRLAQVNEAVCQGCGGCTVTCPSGAMELKGFTNRQILAEVDALCR